MLANGRSLPVDICGAALNLRQMLGQLEMRGRQSSWIDDDVVLCVEGDLEQW
jgi:hypothetical protein